ncbi:sulfotransferase family 2 domain-containing protein [Oscillatoria sp. CS-180]|uniref:sulfotransferase family 2 domain-containing protein n=1 Tax=Oscillatoria sp. CS-180 TaxID=3021720 RepID=UPI0023303F61|nr:sulfotransferase family 2 domain-containing protein [Oscillatoria sp. CS-180]MDB9527389.1 sulfotransferase family 2 domain-containing protein [Oscillatoria sp. CS-180]
MKTLSNRFPRPIRNKIQLIRHKWTDKFLFIHINKTGGTSIAKALNIPPKHDTALEKIEEVGRIEWDKRFTFAVVRNPWDKVVSHYYYRVQTNQTDLGSNQINFKDWVKRVYQEKSRPYYDKPKMFMPQVDWVSDAAGTIIVDHICRFESLEADFREVCDRLEIDYNLPHLKSSKRGNYRDYYDSETTAIVADWYSQDIEKFNYTF